jgi:hypothetical protein
LQAPKNLPPAAKQAKIVEWFRESMCVYSFKELEKLLPSVGSIPSMQVKDYLQAIQDESQIRVEKIGSGNWYWCFKSDAKRSKENIINNLKSEENKLRASIADIDRNIEEEMARREEDEMLEGGGMDRKALLDAHETLLKQMEILENELALYSDNDPTEVLRKVEETKKLKASTMKCTENIELLECFIAGIVDRTQLAEIMKSCCGDEYIMGEGLTDL